MVREVAQALYGEGSEHEPSAGPGLESVGGSAPEAVDRDAVDPDLDPLDVDAIEDLGDEIATLAAHMHAGMQRFLALIAKFDRLKGWEFGGHKNCAYWLSNRTGYDIGTCREYVRVARALETLPRTSAAMASGALSFSQVRALTRVAEPETEQDLLPLAEGCTVDQLERMVRAWKKGSRKDEAEWERERHRSRMLSVFPDDDGMYVVRGRLDPEVGALLMRAVEAASDALYRRERVPRAALEALVNGSGIEKAERDTRREAARRRADALGLVAERALAAGFGGSAPCGCGESGSTEPDSGADSHPMESNDQTPEIDGLLERDAADSGRDCECLSSGVPISGRRAERYQVMLHVESETLSSEGEPGLSELEDGTRVSAETSRRLCCDASVVRVEHGPCGSVLDVGRKSRTLPPSLRRAVEVRDRGCRFPGCGLRFTDGHHIVHWADGGETNLRNTVLLCWHHHRLVHEGKWKVEWVGRAWKRGAGWLEFTDPRGVVHASRGWEPPQRAGARGRRRRRHDRGRNGNGGAHLDSQCPDDRSDLVAGLIAENRRRGVEPGGRTASARWKWESLIPDDVLFRAEEAAL